MSRYTECQIKGCNSPHDARGFCKNHYDRWRRKGHPLAPRHPAKTGTFKERFYSRISLPNKDGCMLWTGSKVKGGYALVNCNGRRVYVHRVAYELMVGPIPDGMELDHVREQGCRSTSCCNPGHLEPVTPAENLRRGNGASARNARKTHCKHDHPFDEENTIILPNGSRKCRECRRINGRKNQRKYEQKRREAAESAYLS